MWKHKVTFVLSPKTKRINSVAAQIATCYKYVLEAGKISSDDGLPIEALGHKATPFVARPDPSFTGDVYVNPMDSQDLSKNLDNLNAALHSAMEHGYKMGIQLHKHLGLE